MKRHLMVVGAAVAVFAGEIGAAPVLAGPPNLPATAKKLSGAEIIALYDGATNKFTDYSSEVPNTGTITFDLKNHVKSGDAKTYGHFLGSVGVEGDKLCGKVGGGDPTCDLVYVDGADIYLVDSNGVVRAIEQKQ